MSCPYRKRKAHQINLQRSLIGSEYLPIRGRGQPFWVSGRERLRVEAHAAVAAGFSAKAAIHPGQVQSINEVFTPSGEALREATAILAAFAQQPGAGAVSIGGRMFDRPHLSAAQRLIVRGRGGRIPQVAEKQDIP